MRTWTKRVLVTLVGGVTLSGGACLSSGDGAPDPELADVIVEGSATRAALAEMVEATVTEDAARGPVITFPPNNSVLHSGEIVTFAWARAVTARNGGGARGGAPAWLRELVGAERSAWAGGEPMNGMGYQLVFTTLTGTRLLRVFTTKTSYTPDEKAWEALSSAGVWTELRVASAGFVTDGLVVGSGPFEGEHVEFCIERE